MKICIKCGEIKSMGEFSNKKLSKDGKHDQCKSCNKKHREENKDKIKEYQKIYREENKEATLEYQKIYYAEHKEESKQYQKNNRKRYWAQTTLYRHKQKGNIISVSTDFVEALAENTFKCNICEINLDWEGGNGLNNNSPSLDRINNENELNKDNIWIICHSCNTTKRDRTMDEFVDYSEMIVNKFKNKPLF